MKKLSLLLSALAIFVFDTSYSQCNVSVSASSVDILCGDTLVLSAIGDGVTAFRNNFNCGAVQCPQGDPTDPNSNVGMWSNSSTAQFNNPCTPAHPSGSPHIWFNQNSPNPRQLATQGIDLTTGGQIFFDMRFADPDENGNASPCENPDAADEGVHLQYSINNGATWVELNYYSPAGGNDATRTNWTTYEWPIPDLAKTVNTRIRWVQLGNTGTPGNYLDHWGLDNCEIIINPPGVQYTWSHTGITLPSGDTPKFTPTETDTYTCTFKFGGKTCTDNVTVNVRRLDVTTSVDPLVICPGDSAKIEAIATQLLPPQFCGLSQTGCVGNTGLANIGTGTLNNTNYYMFGTPPSTGGGGISISSCTNGEGNYVNQGRSQFIIRASEVPNFFKGGQLYYLQLNAIGAFDIAGMTISLGCSSKNSFTSNAQAQFQTGLDEVFSTKSFSFTNGWNQIEFDNAWDWDGKSNIIVQICFTGAPVTGNVLKTATTYNSVIYTETCTAGNGCNLYLAATAITDVNRPTVKFGVCYRPTPDIVYSWTPPETLNNPNKSNPNAGPQTTTTYTVNVWDKNTPMACSVEKTAIVQIEPVADFIPKGDSVCVGTDAKLKSGLSTGVVNWTGPNGFTSTAYNPTLPMATLAMNGVYSITATSPTCGTSTKTVKLVVVSPPNPGVPSPITLCSTSSPLDLFDQLNGEDPNGNWSDDDNSGALSGSILNPNNILQTRLPDTFEFTYTLNTNICGAQEATVSVLVEKQPISGDGIDGSICTSSDPIDLFTFLQNYDENGTWSDDDNASGLTSNMYDPSGTVAGVYKFTYTVGANNPCVPASTTIKLTVFEATDAGEAGNYSMCVDQEVDLFDYLGGTPDNGGEWRDPTSNFIALTNGDRGTLNATNVAQGVYVFQYYVTATGTCTNDSATVTVQINGAPEIISARADCTADREDYNVIAEISGGDRSSYQSSYPGTFTNNPDGTATFTSVDIESDVEVTIKISDANNCGISELTISKSCNCLTASGTMDLSPQVLCFNASVTATYNGGFVDDGNDVQVFYLHRGAGSQLTNIVDSSTTPSFSFKPATMAYGVKYYISAVAGNKEASGYPNKRDGCLSVSPGTPVIWNPPADIRFRANLYTICPGENVVLTFEPRFNTTPFTVTYSANGTQQTVTVTSPNTTVTVNPIANTTYTIISVADSAGCINTSKESPLTVNVNTAPIAQLQNDTLCANDPSLGLTINLQGSGTNFTVWYTNPFTGSRVVKTGLTKPQSNIALSPSDFDGLNSFTDFVLDTVFDNTGSICPGVVTGKLVVAPSPTASLSGSGVYCSGDQIPANLSFTGIGPWDFTLQDQNGTLYSGTSTTRTYTENLIGLPVGANTLSIVSVTDRGSGKSCSVNSGSGSATYTVNAGPVVQLSFINNGLDALTICDGSTPGRISFDATSGTGPNYTVSYTVNGVAQNPVTLTNGHLEFDYPVGPGQYIFTITSVQDQSAAACSGTGSNIATLVIRKLPKVTGAFPTDVCQGGTINFSFTGDGSDAIDFDVVSSTGTNSFTVLGDGTPGTGSIAAPSTPGSETITLNNIRYSTAPSCPNTGANSTYTVNIQAAPTVQFTFPSQTICVGELVDFESVVSASSAVSFDVVDQTGSTLFSKTGNGTLAEKRSIAAGSYTYQFQNIVETSTAACPGTALNSLQLSVVALPTASFNLSANPVCYGTNVLLQNTAIAPGTSGPYTIYYTENGGSEQSYTSGSSPTILGDNSKTIRVNSISDNTVSTTSGMACSSTINTDLNLTVHALPEGQLLSGGEFCENDQARLDFDVQGKAPLTITFQDENGTSISRTFTSEGLATYTFPASTSHTYTAMTITDSNTPTCSNTATGSASVIVNPLPVASISSPTQDGCLPFMAEATIVSNVPLVDCSWDMDNGEVLSDCANLSTVYTNYGSYTISGSLTSDKGCKNTAMFSNYFTVHKDPKADFYVGGEQPTVINNTVQFRNASQGGDSYQWFVETVTPDTLETYEPRVVFPTDSSRTYIVCLRAESIYGCKNSICKPVRVEGEEIIYIPNTFTPDGDGYNEIFLPVTTSLLETNYRMAIYDRWGEELFVTKDKTQGWDGRYQGEFVKVDTYVVIINGHNQFDGAKVQKISHLNVIR